MGNLQGSDGAEQELTALFEAHHRQVVGYVARRTRPAGDLALAQDVAADVFTIAWQHLCAPRQSGDVTPTIGLPWLLVTAGHVLSQHVRDTTRRVAREERAMTDRATAPHNSPDTIGPADVQALSAQVANALDRMAPADRELLLLRVWDELSFAQAAEVLGCSPGAARVRWLRARRRFAAALTRESDLDPLDPAAALPSPIPIPEGDRR